VSAAARPAASAGARPPLLRLTRVEARKTFDTRAGLWLLIVTALIAAGGAVAQALAADGSEAQAGDAFVTAASASTLLLPIVGVLLVTSEWSQRSGLYTFALVPVRLRVVAAKLLAVVALAAAATAVCLVLGLLAGSALGTGAELSAGEAGRGALYLLISVGIGYALGLLLQSSPIAIVFLFVGPLLFGLIGAISASIGDVTEWLDQTGLQTLVDVPFDSVDWAEVGVSALVWIALPLVLGILRLERGDID
jgi:hypothetical protein